MPNDHQGDFRDSFRVGWREADVMTVIESRKQNDPGALLEAADNLADKVGAFLFFNTEGTAKEMADASTAYIEARTAKNPAPISAF